MKRELSEGNSRLDISKDNKAVSLQGLQRAARAILHLWANPIWSALFALVIYALIVPIMKRGFGLSEYPYYNYQADAFLHGQLYLRIVPGNVHDLVHYAGKYYTYWPPFPAILLMPFVAIFGANFSDITFTLFLGAFNVGLVPVLLRLVDQRGVVPISKTMRAVLTLFFAFGTVQFVLVPRGRIWFTGQEVGLLCVLLAFIFALRFRGWKAFLLTGVAVAGAAATRNNMVFAGLWPAFFLFKEHWPQDWTHNWKRLLGYAALAAVPIIATVALLAVYNVVRFGSPTNVGLDYHLMADKFVSDYQKYGAFNLHYLPINFYYQYIYYPFPFTGNSYEGGSLFLMSPMFFAIFFAFYKPSSDRVSMLVLVVSILLINVAILLLMGTGWMQIGPRYTLDFTIPLLILTARGLKKWPAWLVAIALAISIGTYLYGTIIIL